MSESTAASPRLSAPDSGTLAGAEFLRAIQTDAVLRQEMFPVTRTATFLAHAAVAPLPACVSAAIADYAHRAADCGQFEHLHREAESESRRLAAELVGFHPDEIAFSASTSAAL